MKNFEFEYEGKKLWYSRSVAAVGLVISYDECNRYVLACKRGPGCPDEVGKWALPCGYLDFNESIEECMSREANEETGIIINPKEWQLIGIDSNPDEDSRQNITIRFGTIIHKMPIICYEPNNEVTEVEFIKVNEYDKYNWAFNHNELIKNYAVGLSWYEEKFSNGV